MKKLIIIIALLIPVTSYALFDASYVLKTSYGEYEEVYIMPNGIMYQVDLDKLTVEEVYLNSIVLQKLEFRHYETLRDFIDTLGKKKCSTIKGVDKCKEPKRVKED